jgi:hypothetical protein
MPYTIHLMADKVSDTKLIQITSEVEFEIQLVTRYSLLGHPGPPYNIRAISVAAR